jgi:hypothetical protein
MTIHTLEKEKHNDFLKQERIDPITGDILQEGDQVVICASCKSAFLVDSWGYMDYKHCNQTHTLREIPKQEAVKIDRESRNERLDKLAFYQFRTVKNSEVSGVYTGFFLLIGGLILYPSYLLNIVESMGLGLAIMLLGIVAGRKIHTQKTLLLDSRYFIINQNKKNEIIIDSKNIESIQIEKAKLFSRLANSMFFNKGEKFYDLIITTKTGETHKIFISENEVNRVELETNILKKYSALNNLENPTQNIPFVTPQNDRLDLGS